MARKKGGGGKLNRSEIIQARLDPRLHMAAEILARSQRRTLSSLMEVLIESAIEATKVPAMVSDNTQIEAFLLGRKKREKHSIKDIVNLVWSENEAERFAMLALMMPDLLTADEASLWALIINTPYFWGHFQINVENGTGKILGKANWPLVNQKGLVREHLLEYWPLLKEILAGKKSADELKKIKLPIGRHIKKPTDYPHDTKRIDPNHVD